MAFFLLATQRAQAVIDTLPEAVDFPLSEIAVNGFPGRIVERQKAPGAARAVEIKDGIKDQAHISGPSSAAGFGGRDERFDKMPFLVGEVARIELVAHPGILLEPAKTF